MATSKKKAAAKKVVKKTTKRPKRNHVPPTNSEITSNQDEKPLLEEIQTGVVDEDLDGQSSLIISEVLEDDNTGPGEVNTISAKTKNEETPALNSPLAPPASTSTNEELLEKQLSTIKNFLTEDMKKKRWTPQKMNLFLSDHSKNGWIFKWSEEDKTITGSFLESCTATVKIELD